MSHSWVSRYSFKTSTTNAVINTLRVRTTTSFHPLGKPIHFWESAISTPSLIERDCAGLSKTAGKALDTTDSRLRNRRAGRAPCGAYLATPAGDGAYSRIRAA